MPIAKGIAEKENVNLQSYSIIYQAIEAVENAMKGLEAPVYEKSSFRSCWSKDKYLKYLMQVQLQVLFVLDGKIVKRCCC